MDVGSAARSMELSAATDEEPTGMYSRRVCDALTFFSTLSTNSQE